MGEQKTNSIINGLSAIYIIVIVFFVVVAAVGYQDHSPQQGIVNSEQAMVVQTQYYES